MMDRLLPAGDIGGTEAALALVSLADGAWGTVLREAILPSREFGGVGDLLATFLAGCGAGVARVSLSVAGPVVDGRAWPPNLGWQIDARVLGASLVGSLRHCFRCSSPRTFYHKGVMSELLRRIPVSVILEPRAALLGAIGEGLAREAELLTTAYSPAEGDDPRGAASSRDSEVEPQCA